MCISSDMFLQVVSCLPFCMLKPCWFIIATFTMNYMPCIPSFSSYKIVERNGGKVVSRYSAQCTHVLAMNQLGAVCKEVGFAPDRLNYLCHVHPDVSEV